MRKEPRDWQGHNYGAAKRKKKKKKKGPRSPLSALQHPATSIPMKEESTFLFVFCILFVCVLIF